MLNIPEYTINQFVTPLQLLKFRGYVTDLAQISSDFEPDLGLTGEQLDHGLNTWIYAVVEAANHPEIFDFQDIHLHAIVGIHRCDPEYDYIIAPEILEGNLPEPYSDEPLDTHNGIVFILNKLGICHMPTIDFILNQEIKDPNDPRLFKYLEEQASISLAWQQFPGQE